VAPFDAALVASALAIMAPILLTASGELVSEVAGVVNLGLEGMMLTGAFTSFLAAHYTGSAVLGVVAGVGGGIACGLVMALLAIEARVDQILVGIGIGLLAVGATSFLNADLFHGQSPQTVSTLPNVRIPVLADLGGIGRAIFDQNLGVYAAFVALGVATVVLYRTSWGISLRAVGENPASADAAGVSVRGVRWAGVMCAAALAGAAGAQLVIGQVGVFTNGMSAGRGYLALAAVLFGRWRPAGVLAACALFAFMDALQLRLQGLPSVPSIVWIVAAIVIFLIVVVSAWSSMRRGRSIWKALIRGATVTIIVGCLLVAAATHMRITVPASLWLMSPFLLAIVALAIAGERRTAMPSKLAIPFVRGHD
jgi:simple sugar transport system permease protein